MRGNIRYYNEQFRYSYVREEVTVYLNLFLPGAERCSWTSLTAQPGGGASLWVEYTIDRCCISVGTKMGIAWAKYFVVDGADGGVCVNGWQGIRRKVVGYP